MFKIIDLLNGQTVIHQVELDYIEQTLQEAFEIEYLEQLPQICWLSNEAVEGFDLDEPVLKTLAEYVQQHSVFLDSNADDVVDVNEKGCYFGFERVEENADYHVAGTVKRNGKSLPGLRVKLSDVDVLLDDFCGFAFTNEHGFYKISFNVEDFCNLEMSVDFEGLPDLYLEIAQLDFESGDFQTIKHVSQPQTKATDIVCNVDL